MLGSQGEYYIRQSEKLLLDLDEKAKGWRLALAPLYGDDFSGQVCLESRAAFERLLPHIPFIGGDENHLTVTLIEAVQCLAFYLAMKNHGKTAQEAGKILYDSILMHAHIQASAIGASSALTPEQLMERRRRRAQASLQRHYREDYVVAFVDGDGEEFDYGYDFTECAAHKFYKAQGADEFLPYYCALDFAWSQVLGLGLRRMMTLAEGQPRCDHRFKYRSMV